MNDAALKIDEKLIEAVSDALQDEGWEWCFLEIMGHRSHWGRARQEERFGAKMIRIDVPSLNGSRWHDGI
jgi:hypothetical protein